MTVPDRTGRQRTEERRQRRDARWSADRQADRPGAGPATLLLVDSPSRGPLALRRNRVGTRLLARLLAPSLDARLAAGQAPESNRLLATRAAVLVSPVTRCALAQDWSRVLARASVPTGGHDPRVPINRGAVVAGRHTVEELITALSARAPLAARGVAAANCLLSDGTGPLYDRRRSDELGTALRNAVDRLAPGLPA